MYDGLGMDDNFNVVILSSEKVVSFDNFKTLKTRKTFKPRLRQIIHNILPWFTYGIKA